MVVQTPNAEKIVFYRKRVVESKYFQTPVVKAYSMDFDSYGMSIRYVVMGANYVNVLYKEHFSTMWNEAETDNTDGMLSVNLRGLVVNHYYDIMVIAQNSSGKSTTIFDSFQYTYDSQKSTYYMQPYQKWGANISSVKRALADTGNILDFETSYEERTILTYQFKYREIKTEYVFDKDCSLSNILIYFDKNRISTGELQRFVSNALGYLSNGNVRINIDGKEHTYPLYRTSEGLSFVIVYERGNYSIVDYIDASEIDTSATIYK